MGKTYSKEDLERLMAEKVREEEKVLADHQPEEQPAGGGEVDKEFVQRCFVGDELGDSLLFNRLHRGQFVCNLVSGEWLEYQGPHWTVDYKESRAKAAVENVVELYLEHILKPVLEKIKELDEKEDKVQLKQLRLQKKQIEGRINDLRRDYKKNAVLRSCICNRDPLKILHDQLDQHPWLFPVENGVYDLQFQKFYAGGRYDDYLTTCAPTPYQSDADCPRVKNFLMEILGSQEMVDYLQRLLGYAITGLTTEHLFVVFHGPHGRNGKGTLIKVLRKVLGEVVSKMNTEMLMSQKFNKGSSGPSPDVMDMKNKRILWAEETEKGQSFAHGKVKEYSGGGSLKGRGLNDKYMTEFFPSHTLFLICNDLPTAPPHDKAFWSRIRVVTFPYSFESKCTELYHRPVNKDLEYELLQEGPGILNWLFAGTAKWREEGENPPDQVRRDSKKYQESVDDLQEWIDAKCLVDFDDASTENRTAAGNLQTSFQEFFREANPGDTPMGSKEFSDQMEAKGFKKIKSGKNYYQFIRLGLKGDDTQW